jgi:hypothetical protein
MDKKNNTWDYNTWDYNTWDRNTGHRNTWDGNTWDQNTWDRNTWDQNTWNRNTWNRNIGDYNTWNGNIGNYNTVIWNIWCSNAGQYNIWSRNTGCSNIGYHNTWNRNIGDQNTGNRNTGNCNTGYLNTITPTKWLIFNKMATLWDSDWNCIISFPNYFYFDIDTTERVSRDNMTSSEKDDNKYAESMWWYLKECYIDTTLHTYRKRSFDEATKEDVAKTLELPNFDYDIFEEITGITKEDFEKKLWLVEDDAITQAIDLLKSNGYKIIKE